MSDWTVERAHAVPEGGIEAAAHIPTERGTFRFVVFRHADGSPREHVGIVAGDVEGDDVLVGIHTECLPSDVFGSTRCDCATDLQLTLDAIAREGRGVLVYLRGGATGYTACRTLLRDLGVRSVRLMSGTAEQMLQGQVGA